MKKKREILQFGYTDLEGNDVIWGSVEITGKSEKEIAKIKQQAIDQMYEELSDEPIADYMYVESERNAAEDDENLYELKKSIMDLKKQVLQLMENNRNLTEVNESLKRLLKDAYSNGN